MCSPVYLIDYYIAGEDAEDVAKSISGLSNKIKWLTLEIHTA